MESSLLRFQDIFSKYSARGFSGHKKRVYTVDWNIAGDCLATGSADTNIRLWELDHGGLSTILELKGHSDNVEHVSFHPRDPFLLGSASSDKTVNLWDTRSGKKAHSEKTKGANFNIGWKSCGEKLAVGSIDNSVAIYDVRNWQQEKVLQFKMNVYELTWDNLGNIFFVCSSLGHVLAFDGNDPNMPPAMTLECHTGSCYCIAFDPNNRFFATGAADTFVFLWDLQELAPVNSYNHLEWPLRNLSFSHDGCLLATTSEDLLIDIIEVSSCEQVTSIRCHAPQLSVSWHPQQYLLAYAGEERNRNNTEVGMINLFSS